MWRRTSLYGNEVFLRISDQLKYFHLVIVLWAACYYILFVSIFSIFVSVIRHGMCYELRVNMYSPGPFRFVDIYGADRLVAKLQEFETIYGEMFKPCQLLVDHAKNPQLKFHTK